MYYIDNGYVRNTEDELIHHGIKGQKWGVRNDTRSHSQRKFDERIYGKSGSKRIGKRVAKGENLKSARHAEVKRNKFKESAKQSIKGLAQVVAGGALAVGGAMVTVGGYKVVNLNRRTGGRIPTIVDEALNSVGGGLMLGTGAGLVGQGISNIINGQIKEALA